jgi:hypothetical protein
MMTNKPSQHIKLQTLAKNQTTQYLVLASYRRSEAQATRQASVMVCALKKIIFCGKKILIREFLGPYMQL